MIHDDSEMFRPKKRRRKCPRIEDESNHVNEFIGMVENDVAREKEVKFVPFQHKMLFVNPIEILVAVENSILNEDKYGFS